MSNLPDRLILQSPGDEARLTMSAAKRGQEQPAEMLRRLTRRNLRDVDVSAIGGLPAASSSEAGSFAAVLYHRDNAYVFSGAFRTQAMHAKHAETLRASVRSFHPITEAERALAKPLAIRLITASADTRFAALAKTSPLGRHAESTLRLINNRYPTGEPAVGQLIKIVE